MSDLAPETREEAYLYALANDGTVSLTPRTRKEALLKCAIEGRLPDFEPHTRKEAFLHALCMRNASGGSGGGGNTEKVVVLKETTLTFLPHPTLGAYMATNVPLFQLEEGKSYTAVWAGTEYVCVAKTESFSGITAVAIGNKSMLGIGENTGEPFIIFYIPDQQVSSMISTDTEETDRAVAIYQNGGGGIKKTVVLEEIWVEDFFGQVTFGEGDVFGFIQEGVEYTVVWDGAEYTCVGTQYDSYLCLGNLGLYGGNWSSEPFILVTNPSTKESDLVMDDPGTYTLSVYRNEPVGGSGGSDSSDLVKYVTFKSYDGSEEYFKMPVLKGDDCKDPINHGDIETPTKPSTDKKEYTYNGWSLTANGLADSAALSNVTSDRVVYASFEESIKYLRLSDYTWAELAELSASGQASDFALGDTKEVYITSTKVKGTAQLIGINHDTLVSGDKAGMTFKIIDAMNSNGVVDSGGFASFSTADSKTYGYDYSALIDTNKDANTLSARMQTANGFQIKPALKKYYCPKNKKVLEASAHIWQESLSELGVNSTYDEGECYPIYTPNKALTESHEELIRYKTDGVTQISWWTRSTVKTSGGTTWYGVGTDGKPAQYTQTEQRCSFQCFCI